MSQTAWSNIGILSSIAYVCGYCNNTVATDRGYQSGQKIEGNIAKILVCPHCFKPTFLHGNVPTPGLSPGRPVQNVPPLLHDLYDEARRCSSVSAYTAAVLACRKLLMNIAVTNGAKEGQPFVSYVQYLADNHYVPPNGRAWVDHIRKKGNEATHEISPMGKGDAEELITFAEMLLKFIYEFPARVPPAVAAAEASA
ncbi:DUF4145 domain-containing protein [Devosia sp. XK-2]|uniref:DUF4145 domain-containing protein n=1 Tax=Devosia sp. XK-2 TaxID=3126689 RepID=UPI0030D15BFB